MAVKCGSANDDVGWIEWKLYHILIKERNGLDEVVAYIYMRVTDNNLTDV